MPHVASSASAPLSVHSGRSPRSRCHPSGPGRGHSSRAEQVRPPAEPTPPPPGHADARRPGFDLALLSRVLPIKLVEAVVPQPGRGRLPLTHTLYLVLGLCLFPEAAYQEVLQLLWPRISADQPVPNKSSLSRARYRLGWSVVAELFEAIARPLAKIDTPGSFWSGLRLMAVDGLTLEVANNPANEQAFGGQCDKQGNRVGPPQARLVGLVECGTHALVDAALGGYHDGEPELAAKLVRCVVEGMLVLADRGFFGVALWRTYLDAGAHLLWRIKGNVATQIVGRLPDGTYLARVRPSKRQGRWPAGQRPEPILVRIIEYRIDGSAELYRLATSLLDPRTTPALGLAKLYAQRWEFEITAAELKTHQRGRAVVLRSRTPDGVRQEVWAHLILHFGARTLMYEASLNMVDDPDPDHLSITLTLRVIRRSVFQTPLLANQDDPLGTAIAELIQPRALLQRRLRSYPRSVKRPDSRYPRAAPSHHKPGRRPLPPSIELAHVHR